MMQTVTITIAGTTNVGKTSIAYKLKQVLEGYKIKTTVNDFDEVIPQIEWALSTIGQKTEVVINVVQVRRNND